MSNEGVLRRKMRHNSDEVLEEKAINVVNIFHTHKTYK